MAKRPAAPRRRNYEYDHHYGLRLAAVAKSPTPARKAKPTKAAKKR